MKKSLMVTGMALLLSLTPSLVCGARQEDTTSKQNTTPKQDIKDAGHSTKEAVKKTGSATKKETKKVVHKSAAKTKEGANKVEDKTQPN